MPAQLTCPRGHHWEASATESGSSNGGSHQCPICGELPGTVSLPASQSQEHQPSGSTTLREGPAGQDWTGNSATPMLPSGRARLPPTPPTIAGYDITGVLGHGAMGVVYQARDRRLKRVVALKMVLAGAHASPRDRERFRIEAEAVARLQHPNIVQIYEIGEQDGRPYCALEYLDGGTLGARIKEAPLPAAEAARVLELLARAMHAAHAKGIVHRDLKPGNVLIAGNPMLPPSQGVPKIVDFGLAKLLDEDAGQTRTGSVMGTPSYMAPEQAAGKTREVGPAADIYSLGAMLYDALTGRPPFKAETVMDTLQQVLSREPAAPTSLNPKVPRDLETICLKCLDKESERRYANAGELADDLRRFLNGEPIKARPVSVWGRGVKWAKRRPALAAMTALACMAFVIAVGLAGGLWYNAELRAKAVQSLESARQTLNDLTGKIAEQEAKLDGKQKEVKRLEDRVEEKQQEVRQIDKLGRQVARRIRYAADMNLAQAAWETSDIARVLELLDKYMPRPDEDDVRSFEWYYLWRLCHGDRKTLAGHSASVIAVVVSPDDKTIASAGQDRAVILWDAASGEKRTTLPRFNLDVRALAFRPDGKTLAVATWNGAPQNGTVELWDVSAKEPQRQASLAAGGPVFSLAFAPDGGLLAAGCAKGVVKVWEVETRNKLHTLENHGGNVTALAFNPKDHTLATAGEGVAVKLWDLTTGAVPDTLADTGSTVYALAFDPKDGQTLATGGADCMVRLWDVAAHKLRATLAGHRAAVGALAFTTDGRSLASGSSDRTVKLWDVKAERELATIKGHTMGVTRLAFALEDKVLVTGSVDHTLKLWDWTRRQEATILKRPAGAVTALALAPKGTTLAVAGRGKEEGKVVEVWDLAKGGEPVIWRGHKEAIVTMAFSPDGATLATAGHDKTIFLWDVATGKSRELPQKHQGPVLSLAFSRDGKLLASADLGPNNSAVRVWDVARGEEVAAWTGGGGAAVCVAFAADGQTLAVSRSDRTVVLWDFATGKIKDTLQGHPQAVAALAFSPDGATLAAGSNDGTVTLWDWANGRTSAAPLTGHEGPIGALAYAPGGQALAIAVRAKGNAAGSVRWWDAGLSLERMTLRAEPHQLSGAVLAADGRRVVAGTSDGAVIVWDAAGDQEVKADGRN
jgi:WD40 repeat protein